MLFFYVILDEFSTADVVDKIGKRVPVVFGLGRKRVVIDRGIYHIPSGPIDHNGNSAKIKNRTALTIRYLLFSRVSKCRVKGLTSPGMIIIIYFVNSSRTVATAARNNYGHSARKVIYARRRR